MEGKVEPLFLIMLGLAALAIVLVLIALRTYHLLAARLKLSYHTPKQIFSQT